MNISEHLQGVRQLFLDTAPVVYYVEKNPQYLDRVRAVFTQIDNGTLTAVTSQVTLAECLVGPIRLGLEPLQQDFADLVTSGSGTRLVPIDEAVAHRAADLRARYNLSLTDAFQVAVALAAGCEALLTNDDAIKRVSELRVIVLDEVETR